jgi:hypothetical protein
MGAKNSSGRETRKPKAEKNKKASGQTPPAGGALEAVRSSVAKKK